MEIKKEENKVKITIENEVFIIPNWLGFMMFFIGIIMIIASIYVSNIGYVECVEACKQQYTGNLIKLNNITINDSFIPKNINSSLDNIT